MANEGQPLDRIEYTLDAMWDRLVAERDSALEVATISYREAMTEPIWENGQPGPSLAELAGVEVTPDLANFRIQWGIAEALKNVKFDAT